MTSEYPGLFTSDSETFEGLRLPRCCGCDSPSPPTPIPPTPIPTTTGPENPVDIAEVDPSPSPSPCVTSD